MGGNFLAGEWEDVSTALEVSAYSLKSLAVATKDLMSQGGSVVGLTFDARFAWPVYDWMGVAKAAFEATSRYLARDRSEEHTSELQSRGHLVCRLLLEITKDE